MKFWAGLLGTGLVVGCADAQSTARLHGVVELTILHTADLHSQIFPRSTWVGARDAERGLGPYGTEIETGGAARLAAIFGRERARSQRVLAFDSGDAVQGAGVFNAFRGEVELSSLSLLELDAQVLGNHEFDIEAERLAPSYLEFATFPALAANLSALGKAGLHFIEPWTISSAQGLRVGVIGVANPSSPPLLRERSNPYGVAVLEAAEAVQTAIDELRPLVDLIVVLSHLGVDADETLIGRTSGIDLVLGGHQHFVFDEPRAVRDCAAGSDERGSFVVVHGLARYCGPRSVLLVHSGAFAKFVGKLGLRVSDRTEDFSSAHDALDGFEVVAAEFELLPVIEAAGEDAAMAALLEPYRESLGVLLDSGRIEGYAPVPLARYGITQGDSPFGNLVAEALKAVAEADLALINTTGLRADLPRGPISAEQWFEALPFDDALLVVSLFGRDLEQLFDALGKRALERQTSPIQIAGARVRFDAAGCPTSAGCATVSLFEPGSGLVTLDPDRLYSVATTAYLASGPSGYEILGAAARASAGRPVREVVEDFARSAPRCAESPSSLVSCSAEVAAFYAAECQVIASAARLVGCSRGRAPEAAAGDLCRVLPCIEAERDGRIEVWTR